MFKQNTYYKFQLCFNDTPENWHWTLKCPPWNKTSLPNHQCLLDSILILEREYDVVCNLFKHRHADIDLHMLWVLHQQRQKGAGPADCKGPCFESCASLENSVAAISLPQLSQKELGAPEKMQKIQFGRLELKIYRGHHPDNSFHDQPTRIKVWANTFLHAETPQGSSSNHLHTLNWCTHIMLKNTAFQQRINQDCKKKLFRFVFKFKNNITVWKRHWCQKRQEWQKKKVEFLLLTTPTEAHLFSMNVGSCIAGHCQALGLATSLL